MKIYSSKSAPGFYVEGMSNPPADAQEVTSELWLELLEGQATGKIIDFSVEPPGLIEYVKTRQDEIAEAGAKKAELRLIADSTIAPLEDAADLGISTDEETDRLNSWRTYRVLLNRVDTSKAPDITWPPVPAA